MTTASRYLLGLLLITIVAVPAAAQQIGGPPGGLLELKVNCDDGDDLQAALNRAAKAGFALTVEPLPPVGSVQSDERAASVSSSSLPAPLEGTGEPEPPLLRRSFSKRTPPSITSSTSDVEAFIAGSLSLKQLMCELPETFRFGSFEFNPQTGARQRLANDPRNEGWLQANGSTSNAPRTR